MKEKARAKAKGRSKEIWSRTHPTKDEQEGLAAQRKRSKAYSYIAKEDQNGVANEGTSLRVRLFRNRSFILRNEMKRRRVLFTGL